MSSIAALIAAVLGTSCPKDVPVRNEFLDRRDDVAALSALPLKPGIAVDVFEIA